jgi:hypothetical protein
MFGDAGVLLGGVVDGGRFATSLTVVFVAPFG